jgi:hypothetical protein
MLGFETMKEKTIRVGEGAGRRVYEIRYELEKDYEDRFITITITYYPTEYYNHVGQTISIYPWRGGICVDVGYFHYDWNGTGTGDILLQCYDVQAEGVPFLEDPETIEKIKTEEDVYELLELIYDNLLTPAEIFKEQILDSFELE